MPNAKLAMTSTVKVGGNTRKPTPTTTSPNAMLVNAVEDEVGPPSMGSPGPGQIRLVVRRSARARRPMSFTVPIFYAEHPLSIDGASDGGHS